MTTDEIVDRCYNGAIRMTVLTCKMLSSGIAEEEIIRRVRIAERTGQGVDLAMIGLSESIAQAAIRRWKDPVV